MTLGPSQNCWEQSFLSAKEMDEEYHEIEKRLDDLVDATGTTLIYVARVDVSDYRTLTYIYRQTAARTPSSTSFT